MIRQRRISPRRSERSGPLFAITSTFECFGRGGANWGVRRSCDRGTKGGRGSATSLARSFFAGCQLTAVGFQPARGSSGAARPAREGGLFLFATIGFSRSAGLADTIGIKRREGETLVVFCFRIKVAARRRIDLPLPFFIALSCLRPSATSLAGSPPERSSFQLGRPLA